MAEHCPYNPLDYDNLTENLVRALMERGPYSLPLDGAFKGPGVYALFYNGEFHAYQLVRSPDASVPIYVGKAVQKGARKGRKEDGGSELFSRIKEHVNSIQAAENLRLSDFTCRYLVVVPLWITMAERFLLERYQPIWNVCLDGFGNHDPGKRRHQSELSWWDALHPGRAWAEKLTKSRTAEQAMELLRRFSVSPESAESAE